MASLFLDKNSFATFKKFTLPLLAASYKTTGVCKLGASPIFESQEVKDNALILKFKNAETKNGYFNNLLKLEITYCYPMYVPMISTLIRRLMGVIPDPDPLEDWTAPALGGFRNNCLANERFPLTSQGIVRMQTPAKNDAFPSNCD